MGQSDIIVLSIGNVTEIAKTANGSDNSWLDNDSVDILIFQGERFTLFLIIDILRLEYVGIYGR